MRLWGGLRDRLLAVSLCGGGLCVVGPAGDGGKATGPVTDRQTMDLAERRKADRQIAETRREARRDYVRYAEQAADADRDYERTRARVFAEAKSEGLSDRAADLRSRDKAADYKHRRDIASSLAKASLLRIDESERESVTVRDLHASSERVDGLAA